MVMFCLRIHGGLPSSWPTAAIAYLPAPDVVSRSVCQPRMLAQPKQGPPLIPWLYHPPRSLPPCASQDEIALITSLPSRGGALSSPRGRGQGSASSTGSAPRHRAVSLQPRRTRCAKPRSTSRSSPSGSSSISLPAWPCEGALTSVPLDQFVCENYRCHGEPFPRMANRCGQRVHVGHEVFFGGLFSEHVGRPGPADRANRPALSVSIAQSAGWVTRPNRRMPGSLGSAPKRIAWGRTRSSHRSRSKRPST